MSNREPQFPSALGIWVGEGQPGPGWKQADVSANAQFMEPWVSGVVTYKNDWTNANKIFAQKQPGDEATMMFWHDIPQQGALLNMSMLFYRMETTEAALDTPSTITLATAASVDDLVSGNFVRQAQPEWGGKSHDPDDNGVDWWVDSGWVNLDEIEFTYPTEMVFGVRLAVGPSNSADGRVSYLAMWSGN